MVNKVLNCHEMLRLRVCSALAVALEVDVREVAEVQIQPLTAEYAQTVTM